MKHILCNWKMYFSYNQARDWIEQHSDDLDNLSRSSGHEITFFPSIDACAYACERTQDTSITIGAQDCAPYPSGAYTGHIQAASLQQMGCRYCIIGHSETRSEYSLSNKTIANKLQQLNNNSIIPVICIGESQAEHANNTTRDVLNSQIDPLIEHMNADSIYYIAYEPLWSIGTGIVPENDYITPLLKHIKNRISQHSSARIRCIYGGSVSSDTATRLSECPELEGFLIGKASTDFQELKKVVTLL